MKLLVLRSDKKGFENTKNKKTLKLAWRSTTDRTGLHILKKLRFENTKNKKKLKLAWRSTTDRTGLHILKKAPL